MVGVALSHVNEFWGVFGEPLNCYITQTIPDGPVPGNIIYNYDYAHPL